MKDKAPGIRRFFQTTRSLRVGGFFDDGGVDSTLTTVPLEQASPRSWLSLAKLWAVVWDT